MFLEVILVVVVGGAEVTAIEDVFVVDGLQVEVEVGPGGERFSTNLQINMNLKLKFLLHFCDLLFIK